MDIVFCSVIVVIVLHINMLSSFYRNPREELETKTAAGPEENKLRCTHHGGRVPERRAEEDRAARQPSVDEEDIELGDRFLN